MYGMEHNSKMYGIDLHRASKERRGMMVRGHDEESERRARGLQNFYVRGVVEAS